MSEVYCVAQKLAENVLAASFVRFFIGSFLFDNESKQWASVRLYVEISPGVCCSAGKVPSERLCVASAFFDAENKHWASHTRQQIKPCHERNGWQRNGKKSRSGCDSSKRWNLVRSFRLTIRVFPIFYYPIISRKVFLVCMLFELIIGVTKTKTWRKEGLCFCNESKGKGYTHFCNLIF